MCAITNPSLSVKELVSYYSIDAKVAADIFGFVQVEPDKKVRRSDKYGTIYSWCQENVFAQVTAAEIVGARRNFLSDGPQTDRGQARSLS